MVSVDKSYRCLLPSDVSPEYYDLCLDPDLERFTFSGTVKITCEVHVATDRITLHAKELVISSASFTPSGCPTMLADEITLKAKDMTASFGFDEVLPVGKGVLEIKFTGILNDQMAGFYRSKYTDSKGAKKHLATTQFEAIDARRCFPCWDEPGHKAVFVVTLVYPSNLMALSNMPPSRSVEEPDGRRRETFLPTPKMSTYLLAFCIGEFEFISGRTKDGVLARVFACPGNISKLDYALSCTIRALEFYNEFFGIPYPLPKVDMIAIPDFSAGAMENWGLITYREVALLCDEATVSATQKQRICTVITHELAHQWFGNLVTMAWWDDLWLNEGFANWMQTFAADKLHPEWHIWESYVGTEQQRALQLDALRSSHPIQVPIGRAEEVEEVFDAISYCKGGSVVRMIYAVLGEAKFQEGLRLYFERHQYNNTETTDLWKAWADASGKPIEMMMNSWTSQMGFPVLKLHADPSESGGELDVEQGWFLADGSVQPGDTDKTWFTPLIVGTDHGVAPVAFLEPPSKRQKITSAVDPSASWAKLNFGQHVPIRVLYPSAMLAKLVKALPQLPPEDRIGLLSDCYALCKAGMMQPIEMVRLLEGFQGETNDKVWSELSGVLAGLDKVISLGLAPATSEAFTAFAARLVSPAFVAVGWDASPGESDNQKKLRSILIGAVSRFCYKDPAITAEATRRFHEWVAAPNQSGPGALSADIRPAVLSIAMKSCASSELLDQLQASHDCLADAAARIHVYQALGQIESADLRTRVLEWALTEHVRSQDLIYIPSSMALSGKESAEAVFGWVQSSFAKISDRLGKTSMMLFSNIVRISGAGFVTTAKADEVMAFWKSTEVGKLVDKAISQTCEGINSNARFVERLQCSEAAAPAAWGGASSSSL